MVDRDVNALVTEVAKRFEERGIVAVVTRIDAVGGPLLSVAFEVDGRKVASGFRPFGPPTSPEETSFFAETTIHDELEAFGRRMDWRHIDGACKGIPEMPPRSGTAAQIVPAIVEVAEAYAAERRSGSGVSMR